MLKETPEQPGITKRETRLQKVSERVELFKSLITEYFTEQEQAKINEALQLMLELHVMQSDRPGGDPYVSHPLKVATDVTQKFQIHDAELVITALMHDAVEDQAKKLAKMNGQEGDRREAALQEVENRFGPRVRTAVEGLSNPEVAPDEDEYTVYREHVAEAIENPDVCVVKLSDFMCNTRNVKKLDDGERKDRYIKKYGPLFNEVFIPHLQAIETGHPLFSMRDVLVTELEEIYQESFV